jgi:hypothetical protein
MVMENAVATELVYTGVVDGVFTLTVLGDKFRPTKKTNTKGIALYECETLKCQGLSVYLSLIRENGFSFFIRKLSSCPFRAIEDISLGSAVAEVRMCARFLESFTNFSAADCFVVARWTPPRPLGEDVEDSSFVAAATPLRLSGAMRLPPSSMPPRPRPILSGAYLGTMPPIDVESPWHL